MKIVMFYHSLYSDWNHGNAHFLRGIVKAFQRHGHEVQVYESERGWSLQNLLKSERAEILDEFRKYYPTLRPNLYDEARSLKHKSIFSDADVVIVHEWNSPALIEEIGTYKKRYKFKLFFHDTHHRAVSAPHEMKKYNFSNYDGALVFGEVLKDIYLKNNWIKKVWTWHEAADIDLFTPNREEEKIGDLVWIGNWGDNEREEELREFLLNPIRELDLKARFYGVRYPDHILKEMDEIGIEYGGYLPNYKVPEVFSKFNLTVHVPRRFYVQMLPGIPTIRPFEAMACGIPLICSPWEDTEHLFTPSKDFVRATSGESMENWMSQILKSPHLAKSLSDNGRKVIEEKHSCELRAKQFEEIVESINREEFKTLL